MTAKAKNSENDFKEVKEENKLSEIKYKVSELEKASQILFGVKPECARAAFFIAGINEASKNEARKIITDFMKKVVKK